jgi:hypothetical protein
MTDYQTLGNQGLVGTPVTLQSSVGSSRVRGGENETVMTCVRYETLNGAPILHGWRAVFHVEHEVGVMAMV